MATREGNSKGKGLIRSLSRRGTRTDKLRPAEKSVGRRRGPAVCERCGAVFVRLTWRRDRAMTHGFLARVRWVVCPACKQTDRGEALGRVMNKGAYAATNEEVIRQRIENIAARAQFTQPERRLVSIERQGNVLEVLTTSQKLAHRIVQELKKLFRGRAAYHWSDDGTLFATWERSGGRA